MKNLISLLLLCLMPAGSLHAKSVTVPAKPAEVTVYPNSARIIRLGSKNLTAGDATVRFENIPLSAVEQSLSLKAKGPKGTKLSGVRLTTIHNTVVNEKRSRELQDKIQKLKDDQTDLKDSIDARSEEAKILKALSSQAATQAGTSAAALKEMVAASSRAGDRISILYKANRKDQRSQRKLKKRIAALQKELNQIGRGSTSMRVAEADLTLPGEGKVTFELSYLTQQASWTPLYDLRLDSAAKKPAVQISFQGQIRQNTGEDWKRVKLTLSTTLPTAGTDVPDPKNWWLDFYRPRARSSVMKREVKKYLAMEAPAMAGADSLALPAASTTVAHDRAAVQQLPFSTAFEIKRKKDIPSDGQTHRVPVSESSHDSSLLLVTVPRLDKAAFIEADVKYSGEAPLLPGRANLFRDDSFIGATHLDLVAPGENFKLGFGRDELIKVERELMAQKSGDKGLVFKKGERRYHWKITISNYHSSTRKIEVRAQLPRSRQKDIKVDMLDTEPESLPEDESKPSLLRWTLDLKPKEKKTINLRYLVKWPKNQRVIGLE